MTAKTFNLNSGECPRQKIVTNPWLDGRMKEALELYTSYFEDARVTDVTRHTEAGMGKAGDIMTAEFELGGQESCIINGGSHVHIQPADEARERSLLQ